ncbi:MAG: hypothetical protein AAF560_31330 [Acidobacteriota bacterium]
MSQLIPVLFGLLTTANAAHACRCEPRPLAEYFAAADEVFIARLDAVATQGERNVFTFDDAPRHKASGEGERQFVSHKSSASCGIEALPSATYVVFAEHDPDGESSWLSSCSGTRILLAAGRQPQGFEDVPPRFVASQLNGLAGLEVLRRVTASEPKPNDPESERLVGLLDIAPFSHGGTVPLHAAPNPTATEVAKLEGYDALVQRESGYEVAAAVVYAVVDGWYKLRLEEGAFGWLPAEHAGTYWPYAKLPIRRLAYLNEHWSGFVWPELGAGLPQRHPRIGPAERPRYAAQVLESRKIGSSLWFRVELLESNICDGEPPRVILSGWVPAYGERGEPAVWFYSRGC